uniref:Histone-like bacterial DNA-binding protein n=1 Tax=uncultured organism TaxID=155900 RepID=M1PVF6_9ZZZZ|nr:histone-like bacterial DNA-binding protein [uncultured organism]
MNKGELVDQLYQNNDLTKRECREVIDSLVETIVETVSSGEAVKLVNFGTFKPSPRKATEKLHPVSGDKIEVPAKVVPRFSSGKGFDEALEENLKVKKNGSGELKVVQK